MKKLKTFTLVVLLVLCSSFIGCGGGGADIHQSTTTMGQELVKSWPRMFESDGNKVVVHQPQLDDWDNHTTLTGKSAVVVELKGEKKEYYGALNFQANTKIDFDSRTVLLDNFEITKQTFPNIDRDYSSKCRKAVIDALPVGKSDTFSLDRILAGLETFDKITEGVEVNLDPPPIYRSEQSAILVMFMGEPKFEAVEENSKLRYAVNTNWDVLLEAGSSQYFMLNGESWLVTDNILKGEWKTAGKLPKSFSSLPDNENWSAVKKNIPGKESKNIPKVFTSTQPAELILTEGVPSYKLINGTKILYVTNSDSDLFLYSANGNFYFLTSGRWFKAQSLEGPWSSASSDLPDEFRLIPIHHQKARVLSSIPGTPEADAAVLLASVPRKATVDRKTTTVKVVYQGEPEFVVLKGTSSPMHYAVNSPNDVFLVDGRYYCVYNGVWFEAANASGPWIVCTVVPKVIYSIPSTHPKFNVTYVYIYDSTPDTVVVGYTSGYSGTYVVTTGVVMYGVGYWYGYDDYYHYHYHPHYYAYGGSAHYDYYYGGYYQSAQYYGPYGGAGGVAGYDPASGTYYRGGYANGPYGSAFAKEAYNPYTNRSAAQVGATTPYGSWGKTVVGDGSDWARAGHRSEMGKTVAGIETSKGGKAVAGYNKATGQGAVVGKDQYGDIYAGRDGNVYKRGEDGWQKKSGSGWENVDKSKARDSAQSRVDSARSKASTGDWDRDKSSRSRAQSRADSVRSKASTDKFDRYKSSWSSRSSGLGNRSSSRASNFSGRSNNLNRSFQQRQRGNRRASSFQRRSSRGGGRSLPSRSSRGRGGGRSGGGGRGRR